MKMKNINNLKIKLVIILIASAVLLSINSCRSRGKKLETRGEDPLPSEEIKPKKPKQAKKKTPEPKKEKIDDSSDEGLEKISDKLLSQILEGIKTRNYQMFSQNFTYELQQKITKKNFDVLAQKMDDNAGKYISKKFLGVLRKGVLYEILWKGIYEKQTKAGKIFQNDILISFNIAKLDDKYQIFGLFIRY